MLNTNKGSAILNLIVSMVIFAIVVNISLQAFFRLINIYLQQRELTYVIDGAITAFYNLKFDFANLSAENFPRKQNTNQKTPTNKIIDICFNSVGSCLNKVPDTVINIIKQRKLLLNSNIITLYNVPNITYYVALNEKNIMSLYRVVWGEKSETIADGIQAFNVLALQNENSVYHIKLKFSKAKEFVFNLRYKDAPKTPQ